MKRTLSLLTFLCLPVAATCLNAQTPVAVSVEAEALLHRFDSLASLPAPPAKLLSGASHGFLSRLYREGFLDSAPRKQGEDTPHDSLRAEVWYWAAEYLYAAQQFAEAKDYARRALPLLERGTTSRCWPTA